MMNNIKRFVVFDFDGTLMNTPFPEDGMRVWSDVKGIEYPHAGWWSKPESLDLSVFNIKPFPSVLNRLNKEKLIPNTFVIILTSRISKLRPYLELILAKHNISVDLIDMSYDNRTKGEKLLSYIDEMPNLREITVFDDRTKDIDSYISVKNKLRKDITFNIVKADNGNLIIINENTDRIIKIINDVIVDSINNIL